MVFFSKFYRKYYDLICKFNIGLNSFLHQGLSKPKGYGDLVYKLNKKNSEQFTLLLIIFIIYVSCLSRFLVCSLQACGPLLGKGWPLGSLVCDVLLCFCHFPIWYPRSGVVLDCIDSWPLPPFLSCLSLKLLLFNCMPAGRTSDSMTVLT